jgi:hypothetical protein
MRVLLLCSALLCSSGAGVTIQVEVKPEQPEFAVEDPIRLHVTIRNAGGAVVELPDPAARSSQPTYTLRGPQFPEGETFDKADKDGVSFAPRPAPDSERIRIEAGAAWDGTVTLPRTLEAAGEYELQSRLQLAQADAHSPPVRFRVKPVVPDAADVGIGWQPHGDADGELAFLQRAGAETLLYVQRVQEVRPDIGETHLYPIQLSARLGKEAAEVRVPSTNATLHGELKRWLMWREGATVFALDTFGKQLSAKLPAPPEALVRPALRPAGEECEVLALAARGRALQLVRFTAGSGALAWTAPLPAEARAAVVALDPQGKGNVRHLAFAAETDQGIAIFHARYTRDGAPGPFTAMRFEPQRLGTKPPPPPRLFTAVPPALHVDADEVATAGFVAADGKHLFWLEARFPDGAPAADLAVTATPITPLPEPPVSGALLYVEGKDHGIARREVVLQLAGGSMVRLKDGLLQRLQIQGMPTHPMLLLPGRDVSYVVYTDPVRGPYLEQI